MSWPGTRASRRLSPKGATGTASPAGGSAGPRHAGEGQAACPRPDPARRAGGAADAGQCPAEDDRADHRGHGRPEHPRLHRRVRHLRPAGRVGVRAQNRVSRQGRVRARRGRRRLLRGPRQHDGGRLVPAALLAPTPSRPLAGEAAALPPIRFRYCWRNRARPDGRPISRRSVPGPPRRPAMSLKPTPIEPVPEATARIAKAAFRKGNPLLELRDELGAIFRDADFADLFPRRGQPGLAPWRLALVTLLQFREDLADRRAAEAVRARIDWKYLLGLELDDP